MADVQSNIQVSIDTTQALASIKNLQRQIAAFHTSMAKGGAAANAVSAQMQQTLINSINATGKFSAQIRTIRTTTESFTDSLEKNKFSLGEYFRYAGGASKTFGRLFKTEFDTINKVARENVKDLQTQYIRMGRDASGAMKAIAVRPLSLDMSDLATRTMIASEKQALLNQLLKQGSTNLLNFGKNTQWAGRQLMVGFTLPLIALGSAASKTFMDMETQAIRFKKVYGDLFTPQAESKQALKDIQELGKEFTKYGIAVSTTVGLAAEAAAAGFKGVDLQRQTAAATRLSILGQVESQKALETTIALQNAFSMSSENLAESIDFLNAVENQTVLSLDDISTAIPKAAPVVQQLGGDVKDLAFFMTAMKEGGINASEGANALKSGLASMINPTGKAVAMLESFGINIKKIVVDNKGDLKKTVVEFATALNMLDPLNRAQAIEQMFGKFQFARLSTLFANVTKEGTQASRVLDLAGASVQELASLSEKELGMTSESAMNKFKGAVENLKLSLIPLGEEFLKAVTPIAEFITRILDKFNNLSANTKKIIVTITAVVAGLGPVFLMTFGLLANGLANIIKGFVFLKTLFNKTGQSTATLGTEVRYMTTEQRNAAAVAASLDQVHVKLAQTFTSEASAVNALTQAYQRAIAAQSQFVPVAPPLTRGPIPKRAGGKPATVGGTGNKDSELALLMPGETVIPTAMSKKYGGLINAMIADRIPGYEVGKPGPGDIPIYPEYAMRLQDAGENMAQRASATAVPNVLSPLALRIGEARGISPTQRQIDSGAFDSIYDEYKDITTQFVDRVNLEYNETFKDIKDENERMQKAWSAAGKHVEKQVDSIESVKDRSVVRKVFALDEDEYGTIPTDSREKGGTAPNRARRGAFRSRMTGFRSYTDIRAGAKRLFSRKTGTPAESLQMGHVFGPRIVPIETLEADPRRTASVASARKVLDRGKKDGAEYAKGVDSVVKDPYELSQDRSSPHRRAAADGKADGIAYAEARDKAITQSGKKRRVATRGQGPAPIGATPQPGMTVLPIVPPDPKGPAPKPQGRLAKISGKMSSMGGGMGILGANMGLSMAPDFAGKGILQSTLAGANLGMMFGPGGMKAGAAIGLITSAFSALIKKQEEHAAITRSTFTASTDLITLLGDKVLDTQLKITGLSADVTTFVNEFGMLSPEIKAIVDAITKLPEDNPLAILVKQLSESDMKLKSVTGSIRSQVTTAISMGGLDPKNAEKYVLALLTAAGKAHMFGEVWKSVSKDVIDVSTATTVSFDKLNQEVEKSGASWEHYVNGVPRATKGYNDLTTAQQILADQMKDMLGLITSGSLTFDQINTRINALDKSSISSSTAISALSAAILNSGDEAAIERLKGLNRVIEDAGKKGKISTAQFYRMQLALEMLARQGKNLGDVGVELFGAGAQSVSNAFVNLAAASKVSYLKDFFDDLAEQQAILDQTVNDYEDYNDGTDKAKTTTELYIEVLEKEIKGLEAKRDAQKNANDEIQRQIDLETKLRDLAKESVLAKISGDYIKAATLQQQAQNVQAEFNQETELRKKDAEIAKLKARVDELKGGADPTKAELAKIPKDKLAALKKDPKAKNNASGGMIRGAGTGTSDSIPAYLSNGEYVIKANSVKKYGVGTFDALNAGRFANGGIVDPNKVYLPDGTEARRMSRQERDANYRLSRERFLAQRKKYKEFSMPAFTPQEIIRMSGAIPGFKDGGQPTKKWYAGFKALLDKKNWGIGKDKFGKDIHGAVDLPYDLYKHVLFPTALWADRMTRLGPKGSTLASTNQKQEAAWQAQAKAEGIKSVLPSMLGQEALDIAAILPWGKIGGKIANIGFSKATIQKMASEKAAEKLATKVALEQAGIGFRGNLSRMAGSEMLNKFLPKISSFAATKAVIKAKQKTAQPLSQVELELVKALEQAKAGKFTPIEGLGALSYKQLIKELDALVPETGFTPDGQFRYKFIPAKSEDLPGEQVVSQGIKDLIENPHGAEEFVGPPHIIEFEHVATGRHASRLSWDSVTGIIKGMYTEVAFQKQGLARFANAFAASKTRLSHSRRRTPEGRAYSEAIGGMMPGANIATQTPLLVEIAKRLGIKPSVPLPKLTVTPEDSYQAFLNQQRGMAPDASGQMPSGFRYQANNDSLDGRPGFPGGPEAEARRAAREAETRARYEAELAAAAKENERLLAWRQNINRTFETYPFINGSIPRYEDLYDLEELSKLGANVPAGVPWRIESLRPPRNPFAVGPETSAATGGYLNKGKLRVPKFANGGLIKGPGTGLSDSIRATLGYAGGGSIRVSNGEYVVKASSVRDYGVKTMDAINNGTATVGTNSGGTVYNINMPITSNNADAEGVANEVIRKLKLEVSKNNKSNKVGL